MTYVISLSPVVILGLAMVVPVTALQIFLVVKALRGGDSPTKVELSNVEEFKCGVSGRSPGPIYTSYPMATLLITEDIVGVRTPVLGTFVMRKQDDALVTESFSWVRKALVLQSKSQQRQLRVVVSSKDWRAVCDRLNATSWNPRWRSR